MKAIKPIFISLILALFLGTGSVNAINGHKITGLKITTSPEKPTKNVAADYLDLKFKLKSSTGISKERFQVKINSTELKLTNLVDDKENNENHFYIDRDAYEDDTVNGKEFADIYIRIPEVNFSKITNNLEILYLLTSLSEDPPQAYKSKNISASANPDEKSSNNSGGSNDSGNDGSTDTVEITPRLLRISATVVNGDYMVSTVPKKIRLTAYHDTRIIAKVDENGYNAFTNPIITNLRIYTKSPGEKGKGDRIEDQFAFSLETNGDSIDSDLYPSISNEAKTVFVSNGKTLTNGQILTFKVFMKKFTENSGVTVEDDIIMNSRDKIEITAQEFDFNTASLNISDSPIVFNITETRKNKYYYDSEIFNITGTFNGTESMGTIESVEFKRKINGNTKKPKLKNSNNTAKKLSATATVNGTPSVAGDVSNGFTLTIPAQLTVKGTEKSLRNKGFYSSSVAKETIIPIVVSAKTANGLALEVEGTLDLNKTLNFEDPSDSNGSSL